MFANAVRGEVDLDLGGVTFTLRPSYEAVVACEDATGLSLTELALASDDGSLKIGAAAVVVTEMVKAWGKAEKRSSAIGVDRTKIGKLIFDLGVMHVLPRIAIVLLNAASGGVDAQGKPKPIPEPILPGIGETSPGSPPPPLDGAQTPSGRRRRTNSSARSKPGSK